MTRYWINTVSRNHVRIGVEEGFTQANHGRATSLRRLGRGDSVAFYSPRTSYPDGEPLQRFTAAGRVLDDEPYQAEMTTAFHPWRRRLQFRTVRRLPSWDLLDELTFTKGRRQWGFVFRRGLFEIAAEDFQWIARAMKLQLEDR